MHFIALSQHNNDDILKYPKLHMIIIDDGCDSLNNVNVECQKIWNEKKSMKNVFIVIMAKSKNKSDKQCAIDELVRYWNIPYLTLNIDDDKSKLNLFHFIVKYYWFCNAA